MRRVLLGFAAFALALATAAPAHADGGLGDGDSPSLSHEGTTAPTSSPPRQAVVRNCTVYANGTGMGSYCFGGSGDVKTLAEQFGGQKFVACRYEDPPDWVDVPDNPKPDEGRFLLEQCIRDVNWNSYRGGRNMHMSISLQWVPNDADTSVPDNALMNYLWDRASSSTALPVPYMRTQPSQVPVVGYPTFFTFTWVNPTTQEPIAEGPYAGEARGGPYRRITNGSGLTMAAQATKITIDPHLPGVEPLVCDPDDLGYQPGKSAGEQTSECRLTFTRSSAAAAQLQENAPKVPAGYTSAYGLTVKVSWRITYGFEGEPSQTLGDGLRMSLTQPLPVQEVQAPNEPPIVLF